MRSRSQRRASLRVSADQRALRTCVGCRRVLPQRALLRVTRTREGFVEPDPGRRGGGRGAYLCFHERCLTEILRRGRWARAFRAPATARPETVERLRALCGEKTAMCDVMGRPVEPVEGRG